MSKRITQRDVARRAGVSQATVSMTLNGESAGIPPETLARIMAAAQELGYVPNRFAQALRTNKSMTIACIVPDIANPFYSSLMRGIQSVTDGHGYDVIVANTDGTEEKERNFLNWSAQGRVDGVVGVFFCLRAKDFAPFLNAGIPVVRVEAQKKRGGELPIDDIYIDSRAAAQAMVRYLIGKGHRAIGMIAGSGGPEAVRVEGYQLAMQEAGLAPSIVIEEDFSEQAGYRATRHLIEEARLPGAIFAANDLMAIGVMRAAREAHIAIPADLAVAGFDDISAAGLVTPPLTTVAQFQYQIGISAGRILIERLSGNLAAVGTAQEMPFQLIQRDSA